VAAYAPQPVAALAPEWALKAAPNLKLHLLAADRSSVYARALYENLRQLDASGAVRIIVATPPDEADWDAVRDRLKRASTGGAASAPTLLGV